MNEFIVVIARKDGTGEEVGLCIPEAKTPREAEALARTDFDTDLFKVVRVKDGSPRRLAKVLAHLCMNEVDTRGIWDQLAYHLDAQKAVDEIIGNYGLDKSRIYEEAEHIKRDKYGNIDKDQWEGHFFKWNVLDEE